MKKFFVIAIFLSIMFLFFGCDIPGRNDPAVLQRNQEILSTDGEFVGKLPDGRVIKRYPIDMGINDNHFVYLVEDNPAITIHRTESDFNGEVVTYSNKVEVIISGKKYRLTEEK